MNSYVTACDICLKEFRTTNALSKHKLVKHQQEIIGQPCFRIGGTPLTLPQPKVTNISGFSAWMSALVESINSSLNPKAAGKIFIPMII